MTDDHKKEIDELNLRVSLLDREFQVASEHNKRLDQVIEQLKDLTEGISKMIAIHEEKHIQHFKEEARLANLIDEKDDKIEDNLEILHKRINDSEEKILDKLDRMAEKRDEKLDDTFEKRDDIRDRLEERIRGLEKMQWVAIGVISVITLVIRFIPVEAIF